MQNLFLLLGQVFAIKARYIAQITTTLSDTALLAEHAPEIMAELREQMTKLGNPPKHMPDGQVCLESDGKIFRVIIDYLIGVQKLLNPIDLEADFDSDDEHEDDLDIMNSYAIFEKTMKPLGMTNTALKGMHQAFVHDRTSPVLAELTLHFDNIPRCEDPAPIVSGDAPAFVAPIVSGGASASVGPARPRAIRAVATVRLGPAVYSDFKLLSPLQKLMALVGDYD